jgi:hypothetical protein
MHPEYPQNVSAADFTANFTSRPPEQAYPGSYYYTGYNSRYQASADVESRRNVPWQGPAYQGQQMPYQNNAPYGGESQIQPFSSYGGSGRPEPTGLNGMVGRYSMPYQSAPSPMPYQAPAQFTPQPQFSQYPQYPQFPQYPQANFNNTPQPVRNIGTRPNDCWTNDFVAPREVQPPQIDWNQRYQNGAPVGQFEYFSNTPQVFDNFGGNPNMQMSWTDQWFKNKGVYFK